MYVVLTICWCIFYEISASHDVWESVESAGEAGLGGRGGDGSEWGSIQVEI
jgi:hypothetical protein